MVLPTELEACVARRLEQLSEKQPQNVESWQGEDRERLLRTLGLSDFIAESFIHDETLLPWMLERQLPQLRAPHYRKKLKAILDAQLDENSVMRELRRFRRREMTWLAWHDFNNSLSLDESLSHISKLAEAMIMEAYGWLYAKCCEEWGTPYDAEGNPQPMLILGMGKLGGGELNFSSDIDLIFTYPENGETQGARRSIANAQFFTRLGQRLIKALDQQTFDGFCYRVDMRLRPFGDSGPLVMSFAALEDYYQEQGRDWERYAMIKARVMGKEQFACYQTLRQLLRPFVFRRYIDFSAIQSLRRMKALIRSEARRRGVNNNIKIGAGGIREIEFIAQSFQLIRGGRDPILRKRGLFITLGAIRELALLPEADVDTLEASYRFLRRLENLLQAIDDKQTQTLPDTPRDQARLAVAMGEENWDALTASLSHHMAGVHAIFDDLIGDEEEGEDEQISPDFRVIWDGGRDPELVEKILTDMAAPDAADNAMALLRFKEELAKRTLGPRGREVINRLMPVLLSHILCREDGTVVLARIIKLLMRIATRTTYLELLDEHHAAIVQLVRLCSASPMVADQLASYPILLDELLDLQHLYNPTPFEEYGNELFEFLARIPEEDMEQQMEMIRQYKQTQLLRIAAADIAGILPVMKVSDHLTYLAEAIVGAVVNQAWYQMVSKYGQPTHLAGRDGRGFAVVGYGKVGGIELGYGSDLDVVFLHDCPENVYTDGSKEIDGRQFYLRLAQRIVHLFSTRTASGVLYEIDTRLRPSGASGMLVTTVESFEDYQNKEAWTWEHQALVRTRMIYGDLALQKGFAKVRKSVLAKVRDNDALRKDVADMRVKMREHLGSKQADKFHIKQDPGGITDIEFITQYLVLANSHEEPALTRWSDNARILEDMAQAGIVDTSQALALRDAYVLMRDEIHRLNLLDASVEVDDGKFIAEREIVKDAWAMWMTTALVDDETVDEKSPE
ncbi:bifunctional [glutamate--ammonia ligase]-adenylyl-L-tyrosine phosphorylase/[glutamate--ammonia-ligase] adenylyltransferase [Enterovibrio sp. ZSDZ35]|uniref:Bifunctional glutamine synthetase adenylyltransferase/adenylyl-removing enzyme n=1 Tax=Enterovibrio qingdaonensis TaxID=2899818 RepID=A0ABT5QL24_9GAMM|nr:bifunctional [glutamate--ammonia ligase]-adenylyl-L-tyrosine phosphorylase/[glutamate--ammonia-ligase] adenylyltransferase [Enterovibrio sp. ZSDZ35]MDD1781692.1 bifunctional [glutamate--ammonia ligase]-adenylyl-L-tyrosine phosphorylase/[glutamate--ammonia-ligase] adenylyltransferase [Enterovibrio sp. ZSDZ35]